MKKLLLLGSNIHSDKLVSMAKSCGIYTIVTDNRPAEESPLKLLADSYWNISVTDIDELEKKCKEENVTAITCGASEFCLNSVRELCKRLNLPFWMDDVAWNYTNDKAAFKELCSKCGLPVAKDYKLDLSFSREDLDKIEYPVIVKPVDNCSSIGVHMCKTEEELIAGYKDAYDNSPSRHVLVEKCIIGLEVNLIYMFENGVPRFFTAFDSYGDRINGRGQVFGSNPTTFSRDLQVEWAKQLEDLFKELKCQSGVGFLQILVNSEDAAVMEMNYRLPGSHFTNDWQLHKNMLESALGQTLDLSNSEEYKDYSQQQSFIYFIWLEPGVIGKIDGLDKIKANIPVVIMNDSKKVGDEIFPNCGMKQIFTGIIFLSDKESAAEKVDYINKNLVVLDKNGNDMVYRYDYKQF